MEFFDKMPLASIAPDAYLANRRTLILGLRVEGTRVEGLGFRTFFCNYVNFELCLVLVLGIGEERMSSATTPPSVLVLAAATGRKRLPALVLN